MLISYLLSISTHLFHDWVGVRARGNRAELHHGENVSGYLLQTQRQRRCTSWRRQLERKKTPFRFDSLMVYEFHLWVRQHSAYNLWTPGGSSKRIKFSKPMSKNPKNSKKRKRNYFQILPATLPSPTVFWSILGPTSGKTKLPVSHMTSVPLKIQKLKAESWELNFSKAETWILLPQLPQLLGSQVCTIRPGCISTLNPSALTDLGTMGGHT